MWQGYRVEDMWWKMQDKINWRSLVSCLILSLKQCLIMNFWVLREKGGHWSVRRVGYEPELGFCYPEFSVSCQCAYSSPLFTKTNSWAVLLNISLVCGRETQTVSEQTWKSFILIRCFYFAWSLGQHCLGKEERILNGTTSYSQQTFIHEWFLLDRKYFFLQQWHWLVQPLHSQDVSGIHSSLLNVECIWHL